MPYVIKFHYDRDMSEKKKQLRAAHRDYIGQNAHRIMACGGCFPDGADLANGAMVILNSECRQEAIEYIENDPFFLGGIFTEYTIERWKPAIFDYKLV